MSQFKTFIIKKGSRCGNAAKAGKGSRGRPREVFNKEQTNRHTLLGHKNLTSNVSQA